MSMITPGMFDIPLNEIKKPLQDLVGGVLNGAPKILSSDAAPVASNTLAAQSGLSQNVLSGVTYRFTIVLWLTAAPAEGLKFDLNGGTATVSWITAMCKGYDGTSLAFISPIITALGTAVGPQDAFSGKFEVEGTFQASSDGTFIPRLAQTAHSSGSVQALKGSTSTQTEAI